MSGWAPKGYVHVDPFGGGVRCLDCRNSNRLTSASWLCRCAVGVIGAGGSGLHWITDPKSCAHWERA